MHDKGFILCFGNVIHGKRIFYAQATQCTTKASFFVLATLSIAKDLIFSQATQTTVPVLTTQSTAKAPASGPPALSLTNVFSTHNAMHGMCLNSQFTAKASSSVLTTSLMENVFLRTSNVTDGVCMDNAIYGKGYVLCSGNVIHGKRLPTHKQHKRRYLS